MRQLLEKKEGLFRSLAACARSTRSMSSADALVGSVRTTSPSLHACNHVGSANVEPTLDQGMKMMGKRLAAQLPEGLKLESFSRLPVAHIFQIARDLS